MTTPFAHDSEGTPAAAWHDDPRRSRVPDLDLSRYDRLLVVAAHPDDESLGAAGLTSRAVRAGLVVDLVVVTAGEGSHPRSPTTSPAELARRRRDESVEAWRVLGTGRPPLFLDRADGAVADAVADVAAALVEVLGDGRTTLVAAPWRADGHPDHEAAGRAAATACRRTGAELVEYPVWFWHWGRPSEAPWDDVVGVRLDPDDLERKAAAVRAHRTQVAPLSGAAGDETLLGPDVLAHFADATELFVRHPVADTALEDLHAEHDEPWGADQRWYEERKRALTLACLPARRFARALEVGCSTGMLAQALAHRCDELVAVDASPTALRRAADRLQHLGVRTRLVDVPSQWPQEWDGPTFDLVVVSEVGYFLSPRDLDALAARISASLVDPGCVVLCHWRHPVVGWPLDGPEVHDRLVGLLDLPVAARYVDDDVEIVVLAGPALLPRPGS